MRLPLLLGAGNANIKQGPLVRLGEGLWVINSDTAVKAKFELGDGSIIEIELSPNLDPMNIGGPIDISVTVDKPANIYAVRAGPCP